MTLSFQIEAELKEALEALAKKENRSLSNQVDTILKRYLASEGIEWKKEED